MTHPTASEGRPQITFWMLDLDQPLPVGPTPELAVTFMCAETVDAQELAQAMDFDEQAEVVERFDRRCHCYIGRVEDRLATFGWVTFDEEDIGELSLSIRLKPGEAYIWNCVTLPAYRGKRLYPALLTHIIGELHQQGLHRVWICTDADNLPSQIGITHAGFQPVGDIFNNRVLSTRRVWFRARPGISEQLIMDARYALLEGNEGIWQSANSPEFSSGNLSPHRGQPLVRAGDSPEKARAGLILLHGRGASAQDILISTAELNWSGFLYLAPQAAGNTWYPNSFLAPIASNEPNLSSAFAVITSLLEQLAQMGIPAERTILLGFSQGACLLLEYIARHPRHFGGVAGLSGGLIGPEGTPRNYPGSLAGTPVILGCSDVDPFIPKERVEQTAVVLRLLGGNVTMQFYPGMEHIVSQDELHVIQSMMDSVLATAK